ncbi:MAG: NUDIX domain-containing protein [Chlorobium sp.]|nr:MAG: NUDIX domain-containing protein [Chlorobium sp.]
MRHLGASIIFYNRSEQVLLVLRDNIPTIPYPNLWNLPGGHIEEDEAAEECIVREMFEEIEINVVGCKLFRVYEFSDRTEYVFVKEENFDLKNITLHEGQRLQWFTRNEAGQAELAHGFKEVLDDYFKSLPGK